MYKIFTCRKYERKINERKKTERKWYNNNEGRRVMFTLKKFPNADAGS